MSTVLLGRLSNPDREAWQIAVAGQDDDKKHWTDALAAVIPGEALAAYSAIITYFTVKGTDGSTTLKDPDWVWGITLAVWFAIPFAYAASSGKLLRPKRHILRWAVAMVAFAAWLWLLPLSAWDALPMDGQPWDDIKNLDEYKQAATGIAGAFVVVMLAGYVFKKWPLPDGGGSTVTETREPPPSS